MDSAVEGFPPAKTPRRAVPGSRCTGLPAWLFSVTRFGALDNAERMGVLPQVQVSLAEFKTVPGEIVDFFVMIPAKGHQIVEQFSPEAVIRDVVEF